MKIASRLYPRIGFHRVPAVGYAARICMRSAMGRVRLFAFTAFLIVSPALDAISSEVHQAAQSGNIQELETLLAANPERLNETDENGATPLHIAAWHGQFDALKLLLNNGADVAALDAFGQMALHVARSDAIAEALLKAGSPVDVPSASGVTPLHCAAQSGHMDVAQRLLDAGALIEATGFEDKTPLHYAAFFNHPDIVDLLLARGAKVNARMTSGETPLILAARSGAPEIAQMLIAHGAEIDARGNAGAAALHSAATEGHANIVSLLLEQGANVNTRETDPDGFRLTPLIRAADYGHSEIVELLIQRGADVALVDQVYESTALHFAAQSDFAPEAQMDAVMRALLAHGANVNATSNLGETPLHRAVLTGHMDRAELLLRSGADVNAQSAAGLTPLHLAASTGNDEMASRLIRYNAYADLRSRDGSSPLLLAVAQGHVELARQLVTLGADPNAWMINGKSPLMIAVELENIAMADLLLRSGAEVNGANPLNGDTPIIAAAARGQANMIGWLVGHGGNVRIKRQDGETALHVAARGGHLETIDVLLHAGLYVNETDFRGEMPLHEAAATGQLEAAAMLVERTAEMNVVDQDGNSPLHWAAAGGHTDVARALLAGGASVVAKNDLGLIAFDLAARRKSAEADLLAMLTVPGDSEKRTAVGDLGDPAKLEFRGNQAFSADALRAGLIADLNFLIASHPVAPLESYLKTIEARVRAGYFASGFPNATVAAKATGRQILVDIFEGSRFVRGKVRIEGVISLGSLAQRLSGVQPVLGVKDDLPDWSAALDAAKSDAIWQPGEPAPFDTASLGIMTSKIAQKLSEFGYVSPKFDVKVDADPAHGTADLVVRIVDAGAIALIDRIDILGSQRNSHQSIERYLDIKPDAVTDPEALRSIESKLIESGRFAEASVQAQIVKEPSPKRILVVKVVESPFGPALDQPLSHNETVALRVCAWLAGALARKDGYVFDFLDHAHHPLARIVTAADGVSIVIWSLLDRHRVNLASAVTAEGVQLYVDEIALNVDLPPPPAAFYAYVTVLGNELRFGSSFRFDPALDRPTLQVRPFVAGSACLRLAQSMGTDAAAAGRVTIDQDALTMTFDSATGRIIDADTRLPDLFVAVNELWPVLADRLSSVHIAVEPNALERSIEEIAASIPAASAARDIKAAMPALMHLALEALVVHEPLGPAFFPNVPFKTRKLAGQALQKLLGGMDATYLEAASTWFSGQPFAAFTIPSSEPQRTVALEDTLLANLAAEMHGAARQLAPADAWPAAIARIMVLLRGGRELYAGAEIDDVLMREDIGPIGYLVAARAMQEVGSPAYQTFARRGLEVMTVDGFQRDAQLILDADWPLGKMAADIASRLRKLSDDEVRALASLLPAAAGQSLQDVVLALREGDEKPLQEVLQPALEQLWESAASSWVESKLDALAWSAAN